MEQQWKERLRRKEEEYEDKARELERAMEEMEDMRQDRERKEKEHQGQVRRLKEELAGMAAHFEEARRNMQALFDKNLEEKVRELTQGFEEVLRARDEEKERLLAEAAAREVELQH